MNIFTVQEIYLTGCDYIQGSNMSVFVGVRHCSNFWLILPVKNVYDNILHKEIIKGIWVDVPFENLNNAEARAILEMHCIYHRKNGKVKRNMIKFISQFKIQ